MLDDGQVVPWTRLVGGSRRLVDACNDRLRFHLGNPRPIAEDPRFLLSRALVYARMTASSICALRAEASVAHVHALLRPFVEMAVRMLWAVRFGWERYFVWHAAHQLEHVKRGQPYIGAVEFTRALGEAQSAVSAAEVAGMPDFINVLKEVESRERVDPVFLVADPWTETEEEWARRTDWILFKQHCHPAAHGDPVILIDLESDNWAAPSHVILVAATFLVRAVHIQCGWSQEPVMWAYQWITRGQRDTSEPSPCPPESYGDLGLPA